MIIKIKFEPVGARLTTLAEAKRKHEAHPIIQALAILPGEVDSVSIDFQTGWELKTFGQQLDDMMLLRDMSDDEMDAKTHEPGFTARARTIGARRHEAN